jgi:hypothetical protein
MDPLRNNCWFNYGCPLCIERLLVFEIILHSLFSDTFLFPNKIQLFSQYSVPIETKNCLPRSSQSLHRIRERSLEGLKDFGDQQGCVSLKDRQHGSR